MPGKTCTETQSQYSFSTSVGPKGPGRFDKTLATTKPLKDYFDVVLSTLIELIRESKETPLSHTKLSLLIQSIHQTHFNVRTVCDALKWNGVLDTSGQKDKLFARCTDALASCINEITQTLTTHGYTISH